MPKTKQRPRTAQHRPATKKRRYRHDDLVAVDLFSGFGGLSWGIKKAGFGLILAANHNEYKTAVHEKNHPEAEHWIADLVDKESADYHDVRDLPAGDLLTAGVSCVNHSPANTQRAYEQEGTLFDSYDEHYESRVTRSERDRATANCVLHYAARHHPRLILVECTTQLYSWGKLTPGKKSVGDGSTYRWWLKQFDILGYDHKVLYLNSMFFGVGQSRDRGYWVFWKKELPAPDLEHRPESWCHRCDTIVQARQAWRTGIPATGTVTYGKQYTYRCERCRGEVIPPFTPSLDAIDLSNLGKKIGDRPSKTHKDGSFGPLALATMDRAERCRQRFADFPAILMPAKGNHGTERTLSQPLSTQTSQQETALLSSGLLHGQVLAAHRHNGDGKHLTQPMDTVTATHEKAVLVAVDNYQGAPRGVDEPLPTQGGSETLGILTSGVLPVRTHATPRGLDEPMQTLVGGAGSGGISVMSTGVLPFRKHTIPTTHAEPMPTFTSDQIPALMSAASGIPGATDQAFLPRDLAEWGQALAQTPLLECHLRMLGSHEIGRGCGFDVDFGDHQGSFVVWGSERDRTDGYGNAVSPPVGEWISDRMRRAIHSEAAA